MRIRSVVFGTLLAATALTPLRAADMTHERALNVAREPHNWLLHHGNYQGHRFSSLKEINADTVKNMKLAWTLQTDNTPRQLHNLFPPLIVSDVQSFMNSGLRQSPWKGGPNFRRSVFMM